MEITKDTIKHVATLSRLAFNEEELDKFTDQMGSIINMADQLSEVDTEGVEETVQVVDRDTVFREDKPEHWQGQTREALMENVPEKANGYIKVPVIINKDEDIDSLNKKLASGDLSADKLAKDTVANIKDTDKKLNAWITVLDDAKPAENLDFSKSKLAGIPIAIKDNIITNGVKTTAASHILYNYMPMYDATVISKLKKAGVTFVGKTNMDEFAMGSSTEHSYFGATHNPWNLDKVPGGSSGGSAAAVAGGQVVAALGSDTGGSIRQPAAFNGIFGIKPTYGRVSRWGLIAFGSSLDQIGVMTKRVKDSAEVLNVIAGADEHDSTVSTREVPDFTKFIGQDVKGLRVAVPKEYMEAVDGKMREVIQKQIDALKDAGAIINEVSLPHTKYVVPDYYIIASSEASSNLQRYDGIRYGYRAKDTKNLLDVYVKSRSEGFGTEVKRRIMLGSFALSAGSYDRFFRQAAKVRTLICDDFDKIFAENDVIVSF